MNRYKRQFLFSDIAALTMVDGEMTIGAAGAVSAIKGTSVSSVTRLVQGIYQIQLKDNINSFVGSDFTTESPASGANVSDGSFVVGSLYQIQTVGNTSWGSYGLLSGLTPGVGQSFVATSVGGSGSGVAKAVGITGVMDIEVVQVVNSMLKNANSARQLGAAVLIQCLNSSGSLVNPNSGSVIRFNLYFSNSSVLI